MTDRKPLPKSIRFEVFKRDKFTCQYCGAKAPDAVIVVDHVHPVAEGGDNDILNLITACQGCNAGKGARKLDDASAVERKRAQLEELEEKLQLTEMLLEWRQSLVKTRDVAVDGVADHFTLIAGGYRLGPSAIADVRKWLRKYSADEVIQGFEEALAKHWDETLPEPQRQLSLNNAIKRVPAFMLWRRRYGDAGETYAYIQAIFRRKQRNRYLRLVDAIFDTHKQCGLALDDMVRLAQVSDDFDDFEVLCGQAQAAARRAQKEAPQ